MVLAACLVLAAGFQFWLRDSSLVAVEDVKVTGLTTKDAARVRAALVSRRAHDDHPARGPGRARATRSRAYPVVRALEVQADFPHRLEIRVIEHRPAALVGGLPVAGDGTILRGLPVEGRLPEIELRGKLDGDRLTDPARLHAARVAGGAPAPLRGPPRAHRHARRGGHRGRAARRPRAVLRRRHARARQVDRRRARSSPTPRPPAPATSTCGCPGARRRAGCRPRRSRPWRPPAAPSSRRRRAPHRPLRGGSGHRGARTARRNRRRDGAPRRAPRRPRRPRRHPPSQPPHPRIPPGLEGPRRLPDNPQPVG